MKRLDVLGFRAFTSSQELTIARDLWGEKGLEINLGHQKQWSFIDFHIKWDRATDHAGFRVEIELFGFYFYFQVYDGRHWNYEQNRWMTPGEEEAEGEL
jgi:hypothetical protein